jgi:chemotaxis protein MotB
LIGAKNEALNAQYESYKKDCENLKEKLSVVEEILTEEAGKLHKVEALLTTALADFQANGVDVYSKGGLVYVSLPHALLYSSGSAAVNEKGRNALSKLSVVLNQYPKLRVIVSGNTDSIQFKKGSDNLSLSTERANGVVRILRDKYQVDPVRLTSAGKGKYNPVADNTTGEGRAKNRRTDIILNPDLERIWNSVK